MTEQRRLAAILVADVAGYSRLMGSDEAGTLAQLEALRTEIIGPQIAKHAGRLFKSVGDGFLIEFASAVQAVSCAKAIQEANGEGPLPLRIGIHVGDVVVQGDDLLGDGVNVAARVEGIAEPGGIAITRAVHEQVRDKLDLGFVDKGEIALKNIQRPVQVFVTRGARVDDQATTLALPDKPSIAVLPFQNMSGDPEQEYFADGMVEDITTALSRFKSLFVIARNSSFAYKGTSPDIRRVGRELGVRYVLEGSVRRMGKRVRISGQLIQADTGAHIWADRFDGELAEIFELQDQVTLDVVGAIAPRLERAEIERARRKPTGSLDAYDYYLRALAFTYHMDRNGIAQAMTLLERAVELDPQFAIAHGLGAWCYYWRRVNGWTVEAEAEARAVMRLAASAATFGKDDAAALSYAGLALGHVAGQVEAGLELADRAVLLNANLATAWYASGSLRVLQGPLDEAIERMSQALRLSPLDPLGFCTLSYTALAHFLAGRADAAWPLAERACRDQPHFMLALRIAAASNAAAERVAQARVFAARALEIDPTFRLSNLKARIGPLLPDRFAKYAEALRRSGVPH
jgi:TolB-like protein